MKVRELLSDETKWTQGTNARDSEGKGVAASSEEACSWCLIGAIFRCYGIEGSFRVEERVRLSLGSAITKWNDVSWRTFAEVKDLAGHLDI